MSDYLREASREKLARSLGVLRDPVEPGGVSVVEIRRPRPAPRPAVEPACAECCEPASWRDLWEALAVAGLLMLMVATAIALGLN